jgi:hypothetical protein
LQKRRTNSADADFVPLVRLLHADHWCQKGHIVHCLEGEFVSEMDDGTSFLLKKGMTYVVSDGVSTHRSKTENGVKLLIVDGDFLDRPNPSPGSGTGRTGTAP